MCKWFKESNRWKHFVLGIPEGFLISFLFAVGCATGMEVKDCHYDSINANKPIYKWNFRRWDWLDWLMTTSGGFIGAFLKYLLIYFVLKWTGILSQLCSVFM